MTSVLKYPPIGSLWYNGSYQIEIIDHNDPRNIDLQGNYIKSKKKHYLCIFNSTGRKNRWMFWY